MPEHLHCFCQRVFVPPMPDAHSSIHPMIAHDQCCICGERQVAPPAGTSKLAEEEPPCLRLHVPPCARCGKAQTQPGSLLFDATESATHPEKLHVCVECVASIRQSGV